jgi:enoyl-CoA hydratase/carnithine racemase
MIFKLEKIHSYTAMVTISAENIENKDYKNIFWNFEDIINNIAEDQSIRSCILISEIQGFYESEVSLKHHNFAINNSLTGLLSKLKIPIIGCAYDSAYNIGFEILLACDIRMSNVGSIFSMNQIQSGYIPFEGGTQRLPRIIGTGRALDLVLTGRALNTVEAYDYGVIQYVSENQLKTDALGIADKINSVAPIASKFVKESILNGIDMTLTQGMSLEADLSFILQSTEDRAEGLDSFHHKRAPDFRGI